MWRRTKGAAPRGRARAVVAASDFRVAGEEVKELRGEVWGQCSAGTGRGNSDRSGWPPPGELAAGNRPVRLPPSGTRDFIKARGGWRGGRDGQRSRTLPTQKKGGDGWERRPPVGTAARRAANGAPLTKKKRGDGLERRPPVGTPRGPPVGTAARRAADGAPPTEKKRAAPAALQLRPYALPPACGGLCRPEVGVPSRPRASTQSALRGSARLRRAVPTGGRRSLPPALLIPRSRRASRTRPPTAWSPLPTPDRQAAAE